MGRDPSIWLVNWMRNEGARERPAQAKPGRARGWGVANGPSRAKARLLVLHRDGERAGVLAGGLVGSDVERATHIEAVSAARGQRAVGF